MIGDYICNISRPGASEAARRMLEALDEKRKEEAWAADLVRIRKLYPIPKKCLYCLFE